ncbi:uncharacterized protein [Parasteatoda tepidariorum]|uniref:uncharacterized protein n=1 Tax=Parasteatoda tepidariorum TaxID=114398 RepID=UPI00077F8475|nr:uncharacterized protein LOC107447632 [Parasteatoda tepidariorum]XP_042910244.1 uncharacterized protein LOC107447632 [Parasteatoda tepidariorum]XP_042910245.1 uncharacterized protein LOC107447632 [Parasteatoda tepidariorum]XP_042910246.1 uncharacterized protein LOC107447632 [Parasteatoda tepidariorum]
MERKLLPNGTYWAVNCPPKNSLFWSILIPFLLISAEKGELENSLKLLGEDDDPEFKRLLIKKERREMASCEVIKRCIKNINPFKNMNVSYNDKTLVNLMQRLKAKLNQAAYNLKKLNGGQYDDYLKLQTAANIVELKINLYGENDVLINSYCPAGGLVERFEEEKEIIIFHQVKPKIKNPSENVNEYRFGMEEVDSQSQRNKALRHILKFGKIEQNKIDKLINSNPSNELLLHILKKNSDRDVVHKIYESCFILKKLTSAGYDMNPGTISGGDLSAFYYCFQYEDWDLFLRLSNYPTKNLDNVQDNLHFSDEKHLRALISFDKALRNDGIILRRSSIDVNHIIWTSYDQASYFLRFHIQVLAEKIEIRKSPNKSNKKLMKFLIKKYGEFFHFNNENSFKSYFKHYKYHKTLDEAFMVFFVDCFLQLRDVADDNNQQIYVDALISLVKCFCSKSCFDELSSNNGHIDEEAKFYIFFYYRREWKKSLDELLKLLESNVVLGNKKTTKYILEKCTETCPLIKEEFALTKLKKGFKIADETFFDSEPLKSTFIVQRALEMFGEVICTIGDGCMTTPLIRYFLPPDLERVFCDLRNNCLAHYKTAYIEGKEAIEKDFALKDIQPELKQLIENLDPIFAMQMFRLKLDLIENCLKGSGNNTDGFSNEIRNFLLNMKTNILKSREDAYLQHKDIYVSLLRKILDSIYQGLTNKIIKTVKELRRRCDYLKFLLTFVTENSSILKHLSNVVEEIDTIFTANSSDDVSDELAKDLLKVLTITKTGLDVETNNELDSLIHNDFPNLKDLFKKMKENKLFKPYEADRVKLRLTESLKGCSEARESLISHFHNIKTLPQAEIYSCIKKLFVPESKKKKLRNSIKDPSKALSILHEIKDTGETILGKTEEVSHNFMKISSQDMFKPLIKNLELRSDLHQKIHDAHIKKLDFVIERIEYMKVILSSGSKEIPKWLNHVKSEAGKSHTKWLMAQRYTEEPDTRAAFETLLLDCLDVFKSNENCKKLWLKSSSLFHGLNLRNILSHFNPIVEISSDLLDPDNLPWEFMDVAHDLLEILDVLVALRNLYREMKKPQKKNLLAQIGNNEDRKFADLVKTIRSCEKWEDYLFLLPDDG